MLGKEPNPFRLVARCRFATDQFAENEEPVDVVGERRGVRVLGSIPHGQ